MVPKYDNLLMSSFLTWMDHEILSNEQSFTNYDSKLYPTSQTFNNYCQYNFPFSQLVSDASIPNNPQIPTGLYLNSTFCPVGTSGLVAINYSKGQVYFSTGLSSNVTVSGRYAVKEFGVSLINIPERELLFETKLSLRPKTVQMAMTGPNVTGISPNTIFYPSVFIKNMGGKNEPLCMGGLDLTVSNFGAFIFADSQYSLDGIISVFRDSSRKYVPLFKTGENSTFNVFGYPKTGIFDYNAATLNRVANGSGVYIENVDISRFERGNYTNLTNLNPECYFAVADFKLSHPRYPRL